MPVCNSVIFHREELYLLDHRIMWKYWKWNKIHGDYDGRGADFFRRTFFILCIIIDVEIWFFFSKRLILSFLINMISTCAGIDKNAFYLDFKGVLSSKPQVSVPKWGI
jgi:hypothetical protein